MEERQDVARIIKRQLFAGEPAMPIDTHVRIAAWLHIVLGAIAVCVLGLVGLFFGVFGAALAGASLHGVEAGILGWIAGFGLTVFLVILAFPVLEIVGGVMLLGGNPAGKVITLIFSVLGLINVPIGTAIGIYSLWALLRDVPPPPSAMTAPVGSMPPY
jgi:hypothetical protein